MLIAELVGLVALVALHFHLTSRISKLFITRLAEQDAAHEGRAQAVQKQQKAAQTVIAQQQRAMEILANQIRAAHDESRLLHQRVDQHFAHPNVKRIING